MKLEYEYLNKYEVIEKKYISDISSKEILLKHKKSGARVLCFMNDDNNKAFYIAFRTLPCNDKGIPHILEHTILCESKNYKNINTFSEISKNSLCTFMNAITFSDKTVYPFATCNESEYLKVMDIYLDSVFNANIIYSDKYFKQEGWHYELKSYEDLLMINGVVFNEMKGRYSSQNRILKNSIYKSLFPDTSYCFDSGGNPEEIVKSSYIDVKKFYLKFYHPSNSYIYLYGNINIYKYLKFLDEQYLRFFKMRKIPNIKFQKPLKKTKEYNNFYSIPVHLNDKNRTIYSLNYAVSTALNKELYQAFDVIDYVLIKSPEAPVRRALLDSKYCSDVLSFYEVGIKQPIYSIVVRGTNPEYKLRIRDIIESTIQNVIQNGIDAKTLLAGINKLEFEFRQADYGNFPKGLYYGMTCLDSWLYDDKQPILHLDCLKIFDFLKKQVNTDYYVKIIENYLLYNNHMSTVILKPIRGYKNQIESEAQKKLEKYKKYLNKEDKIKIIKETPTFSNIVKENNVNVVSMININQINTKPKYLKNNIYFYKNIKYINHNINTNGIIYIKFMFNMDDFASESDILFLELHSRLFGCLDTQSKKNFILMDEMNLYSGGMTSCINVYPDVKNIDKVSVRYEVEIKIYEHNLDKMLNNLWNIIQNSFFGDIEKLKKLISMIQSRTELMLSKDGKTCAIVRSMASFSKMAYYKELLRGISFYRFINRVEKLFDDNPKYVIEMLENINSIIFNRERLEISVTCNDKLSLKATSIMNRYLCLLNSNNIRVEQLFCNKFGKKEAFIDELSNYNIAVSGNYKNENYKYVGYLQILKVILDYDFLYLNIRKKGGAYGNMSSFLRNGDTYFASYRDPNMKQTIDVIHGMSNFIETLSINDQLINNYKIGALRKLEFPLTPHSEGIYSMSLLLQNVTYEDLQREKDEILFANLQDIRRLSDLIQCVIKQDSICVIGNEEKIMKYKGFFDRFESLK